MFCDSTRAIFYTSYYCTDINYCDVLFTKYSGVLYRRVQEAIDGVNTKLQENLAGIRVVKAFRRETQQIEQFSGLNDTLTKRFITAEQIVCVLVPFTMFVVNLGIVAALWLGAIKVEAGTLQVGAILAFINYLTIILNGLMTSSMVLMQIARAIPSGERIVDVLNKVAVKEAENPLTSPIQGAIDFHNVSYRYYESAEDVLKNITFSVKPGQTVGLIGKTGSGKSTLVKLLPRLFDPTGGEIHLDGKPLNDYAISTLRKHIGFTSQKHYCSQVQLTIIFVLVKRMQRQSNYSKLLMQHVPLNLWTGWIKA